jgi:hypothetical protein
MRNHHNLLGLGAQPRVLIVVEMVVVTAQPLTNPPRAVFDAERVKDPLFRVPSRGAGPMRRRRVRGEGGGGGGREGFEGGEIEGGEFGVGFEVGARLASCGEREVSRFSQIQWWEPLQRAVCEDSRNRCRRGGRSLLAIRGGGASVSLPLSSARSGARSCQIGRLGTRGKKGGGDCR